MLDDLRERLARTRWPDQIPDSGWDYGTDLAYLQDLCEHWRTKFDWRAQEERFNRWPHFLTDIDGQQIHFIHARSDNPDALPLIITHGWPGSVAGVPRRDRAAPRATSTSSRRRSPATAGRARRREPGWDVQRVAEAWATLMARLGYDRYGAQGGDWGAMISARLAGRSTPSTASGCTATCCWPSPTTRAASSSPSRSMADLASAGEFMQTGAAYQEIQGKNPQTLGYGLTDSPAGLAGWIVEKFRAWTDNDGSPEDAVTRDQILTNLTRLLGHEDDQLVDPPLLRVAARPTGSARPASTSTCRPRPRCSPRRSSASRRPTRRRASTSCATPASTAAGTSPRSRSPTCWCKTSQEFFGEPG